MNIDTLLDSMGKDINRLSREAFEMIMMLVNNGILPRDAISKALEGFNGAYYTAVSSGLGEILKTSVSSEYVKDMRVSNMTLSKALYHHQSTVTAQAKAIINEQLKTAGTVKELATRLYEGYNFKDDPLKIKKGLPKYLIKEVDALSVKMADKLRTPALRASYLALLNAKSEGEYKSKLKQAVYERNRYYANRIAQTETFRAYSEGEALLHMEDKKLTTIKIKMSASHPVEDICDYHSSVDLYGLGAGVYPKEKAPLPPYHPWCRCRTISKHSIDSTGAKLNPNAPKELMDKFPIHVQNRIIGSSAKLERFRRGEDIEKILNDGVSADYRLKFVGGVDRVSDGSKTIGYNSTIPNTTSDITKMTDNEKSLMTEWSLDRADKTFSNLRGVYWGWNADPMLIEKSKVLDTMFEKYDSSYPKDTTIFRGIRFKKATQKDKYYELLDAYQTVNKTDTVSIDIAPSSFSKEEKTAKKFGSFDDKRYYTILFMLSKRKSNDLDIESISVNKGQREIIIPTHKARYNIVDITISELKDQTVIILEEH
jgi:hypothetical protein